STYTFVNYTLVFCSIVLFFFQCYGHHPHLHSFPTRRSSDLPIDLPDLDSADMQETSQEEYCENCGRVMVLKRGRFGQFMACTGRSEEHTSELQSRGHLVCRLLLEKKKKQR